MATLKDYCKNKIGMENLWGKYRGYSEFLNEGYNDIFNITKTLTRGTDLWNDSYYASLGNLVNALNPCNNIRKGLNRLFNIVINPNHDNKVGFVIFNSVTNELWLSYYDGTAEEYNELVKDNKSLIDRYIIMYGKSLIIEKAYVSEDGKYSPYNIGSGKGCHSAAAYLMYQAAYQFFILGDNKILNDFSKLYSSFTKSSLLTDNEKDEAAEIMTKLENDIFIKTITSEGQLPNVPFEKFELPEENSDTVWKGYKKETLKKSKISIKKVMNVGKIAHDGTYKVVDGNNELVPTKYDSFIPDEETINACKLIYKMKNIPETPVMNMLFTGEAGTGKSTAAQLIARMCNLPYRFMTMSADTTVSDLLLNILPGKKANTFEHYESEFVKAFRDGGIIEIQEVNTVRKPNVLTSLNAALDDLKELHLPNGEIIKRHENCIVIFTANIAYEGTSPMNQALLSRCFWKAEYQLPSDEVLAKRICEKSGINHDVAEKMVKVMKSIQAILEEEGETNGICSFREIVAWAKAAVMLDDIKVAGYNTIINSGTFDQDIKPRLEQAINVYF